MRNRTLSLLSLAVGIAIFVGSAAGAQPVVQKKTLTRDGARVVLDAAVAEAQRRNTTGMIVVVDDAGVLLAAERMDGTFAASATVALGKARTAAIFRKPTRFFEDVIRNGRTPMIALSDFTPLQGGVPIEVDGQVVGAIGISGAASAQEDDDIATLAAAALSSAAANAK